MDDRHILALFAARDEAALSELSRKYGSSCKRAARELLGSDEDAEEVFNDALHNLWRAIPPAEPENLGAYLMKTVRALAAERLRGRTAKKRGGGLAELPLEQAYAAAAPENVESAVDGALLTDAINRFLRTVSADARTVFIQRYGNDCTVAEIAAAYGMSQGSVLVSLMRTRKKLWSALKKEGFL